MKRSWTYRLHIILFLLPALILFIGILIAPIAMSVYYSLYDFDSIPSSTLSSEDYVGLDNYKTLFSKTIISEKTGKARANADRYLGEGLINAFILAALSTFIQLPLALFIALKLSKGIRGERTYLSIFFMPVLISTVIIGRLWMNIYYPSGMGGILNKILEALGMDQYIFTKIGDQIRSNTPLLQKSAKTSYDIFGGNWLAYKETALIAVFIPILWQYVGYHMLLMYAGIKGVPADLLEAAQLDGCTEGQVNRHIVIPYIKPILKVCVIFAVTGSLKSFDLAYTLLKDNVDKAWLPSTMMYRLSFLNTKLGIGSAIAVVLIVLCFAFALLINLAFRDRGEKVS